VLGLLRGGIAMKRLAIVSVLALAACAGDPEPMMTTAAAPMAMEAAPMAEPTPTPTVIAPVAEPAPVAAAEPEKPTPPPVMGMKAHEVPKPDPRTLVYLASYKTEMAAQKGFKVLAKASPILAKQEPITRGVDLGKKGNWVRLYGMAADEAERTKICGQLAKRVDECGARNRE
jgi:hypothetical protein